MRESGDEKSTLRQIEKIKALSEDMLEYQAIDVHKAWQSMERRAKRKASMRMFSLFFTRAAAILVVPLLISSLFFSYLYYTTGRNVKTGASVVFAEISSMPGTITRLVLPDQSVVWLNAGSRLVYPSVFDEKERKVQLFGEGYFEVEADPEHPFSVSTMLSGTMNGSAWNRTNRSCLIRKAVCSVFLLSIWMRRWIGERGGWYFEILL